VTPQQYDAWYEAPRGAWIGDLEYRLLRRTLGPRSGASLLDIGCGTGYFSRRLALDGHAVTGVDLDPAMIEYARQRAAASATRAAMRLRFRSPSARSITASLSRRCASCAKSGARWPR